MIMAAHAPPAGHDAHENRHRIPRQPVARKPRKPAPIERFGGAVVLEHQRRAPGPPVVPRHQHAVDVRFGDARVGAQGGGDVGGGDVFGFPAVGVAEAVLEEPAAVGVAAEGVAGAVVQVARFENIACEFLVGGFGRVVVARESGGVGDGDEDFAAGVVGGAGAEVGGVGGAGDEAGEGVGADGDEGVVEEEAEEEAVMADGGGGEGVAGVVDGGEEAFGAGEEFGDFGDGEAVLEFGPYVGPHAVAEDATHFVRGVERGGGRGEQVPRGFPDVDEEG